MTKFITILCVIISNFTARNAQAQQIPTSMTSNERAFALQLLTETSYALPNSINGLSEAQLNFKGAPNKWSIAECIKHIAAAEKELWAMAQPALNRSVNPQKRSAIKFTDEQLVAAVKDRTHKSKTFAALEPANSPYRTVAEAIAAFQKNRNKLIAFVQSTKVDLRNHVLELPLGTFDTYQFILLIAAHTDRHIQQLNEVKNTLK